MQLDLAAIWQAEDATTPPPAGQAEGTKVSVGTNDSIVGTQIADSIASLSGGAGDDQIWGLGGNETLRGGTENDRLYGGEGIDGLFGNAGDDWLYGENGNDSLVGEVGNDVLYGGAGADTLTANDGDDALYGGSGGDRLDGGAGNDTLAGGTDTATLGDTLTGGTGDDTFVFRFGVTETAGGTTETFAQWLVDNGCGYAVSGNKLCDGISQGLFSSKYNSWLDHLVETYALGTDLNGDNEIAVGFQQNNSSGTPIIEGMSQNDLYALFGDCETVVTKAGKNGQARYYCSTFSTGGPPVITLAQGEGNDTVTDFGDGADKLRFEGMTSSQFQALVDDGTIMFGVGDGNDTVISWTGGQVRLSNYTPVDLGGNGLSADDMMPFIQFDTV
jgi:Ca2+-binding RTX toxin-like protein